ncbi:MAG: cell wall-active antibiotics response protein [Chloroflexi bacterium]|nr:cell wall-active antibiotics response protein [Chloroflexota bacterium]
MTRASSWQMFWAGFLIIVGLLLLAGNLGLILFRWDQVWAVLLILIGVSFVWRGFRPRDDKFPGDYAWGFGKYRPNLDGKTIQRESFSHGFGDLDVDLTRAIFPDGESVVHASHGFGDLTIFVPRDLAVRVNARAGFGDAQVFGDKSDGIGPHIEYQSDDYASAPRKLRIEASVGFGDVEVQKVGA